MVTNSVFTIEAVQLMKKYGSFTALDNLSLKIEGAKYAMRLVWIQWSLQVLAYLTVKCVAPPGINFSLGCMYAFKFFFDGFSAYINHM